MNYCRSGFQETVQKLSKKREVNADMKETIERLKREAKAANEEDRSNGKEAGFNAASKMAYRILVSITKVSDDIDAAVNGVSFTRAMDYIPAWLGGIIFDSIDEDEQLVDEDSYAEGFIEGVMDFWRQVENELE